MWDDNTLTGAAQYCSQLVTNEQQLQKLVSTASYDAVTMASGATDLINEAGTAKITGEEERYSNTDFVVFQANVDGAMEVVNLLQPYLKQADPSLVTQINQQHAPSRRPLRRTRPRRATTTPATWSTPRCSTPSAARCRPRSRPSPRRCRRCRGRSPERGRLTVPPWPDR